MKAAPAASSAGRHPQRHPNTLNTFPTYLIERKRKLARRSRKNALLTARRQAKK